MLYVLGLLTMGAHAQEICPLPGKPKGVHSVREFQSVAVLDKGRIKPMDTYARSLMLQFSGRASFGRVSASQWLLKLLCAPQATMGDKVFLVNHPDVVEALGIEPEKKRRYSYLQVEPHLAKLQELAHAAQKIDDKSRSIADTELIRLFNNVDLYAQLSHVLGFALPHPDFAVTDAHMRKTLMLPENQTVFSFLDIALRSPILQESAERIEHKNMTEWTKEDQFLMGLVGKLFQWSMLYKDLPLYLIPSADLSEDSWVSPWDAIEQGFHTAMTRDQMVTLQQTVEAYWQGQPAQFETALKSFKTSVRTLVNEREKSLIDRISLESVYNASNIFLWAKVLYLIAFGLFLWSLSSSWGWLYRIGLGIVLLATAVHSAGLGMRILILGRPPVSNLYETFIFVGLISVCAGLLIEWNNRRWIGLVVSSLCGFVFLTIAGRFAAEGDTLQMLVAVLNSNFWLSTHVLSITIGYAGCCVAGVLGHVYLVQSMCKREPKVLDNTYKNMLGTLGFGLAMTFLGTTLGGVWADQSWGRFWGWDPKENGALMIVLWTALIFHARIGGMIGPVGVAVTSVIGLIVVMWAWFGVNLLSVGLHSYGFTSGLAWNLAIYCFLEVLFLCFTVPLIRRKQRI